VSAVVLPASGRGVAPLAWLRERGMGASILVSAISTAFGVILISATGYIAALLRADPYIGDSGTLAFVLSFLTVLLVGVAVYVAAIVTANTFAHGRRRPDAADRPPPPHRRIGAFAAHGARPAGACRGGDRSAPGPRRRNAGRDHRGRCVRLGRWGLDVAYAPVSRCSSFPR